MIMHNALQPRDEISKLFERGKKGGREYPNIVDCVDAAIQELGECPDK